MKNRRTSNTVVKYAGLTAISKKSHSIDGRTDMNTTNATAATGVVKK